ncbi:AGAP007547-PA-like protein [Anopheles sinensis]|uniref:AGAP007547-PA-like protein n=2 Tax=Anopheles TaxID=44482 RepID=A0A084WNH8_ANOSI|nr:AGAP007547-PA-like protein [Anopheles sinensis]
MRMDIFRWLPGACGSLGPALIPPAHIAVLWYFWQNYSRFVDKRFCSCSCWDTVFKGTYESGIASYKHMYFNATQNTMKMWLLIVVGVIALYECTKHLVQLLLQSKVRYTMIVLFLLSIFSHYYAWWAYLNYYNDEYYHQWNHQLFFTITELISTSFVLHLANVENQVTARKTLSIVGIALLHILASGVDQFISNVFRGEGYPHQVVRDLGFMIPDVMHLILPLWLLRQTRLESFSTRPFYRDRNLRRDVVLMFFVVTVLFTICSFL